MTTYATDYSSIWKLLVLANSTFDRTDDLVTTVLYEDIYYQYYMTIEFSGEAIIASDFINGFDLNEFFLLGPTVNGVQLNGGEATGGSDYINGSSGGDKILGRGGDDYIHGHDARDVLKGNSGDDELHGGDGRDKLIGGSGNDLIYGGEGNDNIKGGGGNDALFGGAGNDKMSGGGGDDSLEGSAGNDTFITGKGDDFVYTHGGSDTIIIKNFNKGDDLTHIWDFDVETDQIKIVGNFGASYEGATGLDVKDYFESNGFSIFWSANDAWLDIRGPFGSSFDDISLTNLNLNDRDDIWDAFILV